MECKDCELFFLLLSFSDGVKTAARLSYWMFFVFCEIKFNDVADFSAELIGELSTELN